LARYFFKLFLAAFSTLRRTVSRQAERGIKSTSPQRKQGMLQTRRLHSGLVVKRLPKRRTLMSLLSWLRNRTTTRSPRVRTPNRHAARRFRPQLETLERRDVPSTLTVTSAADSGAGTLRADIAAAHSGDIINFSPSLDGKTITLTSGELLLNKGVTIQGPGAAQLTISGNNTSRVFEVNAVNQTVDLSGLTISNGYASSGFGGGIYNYDARLTISDCNINHCVAIHGGGIFSTLNRLTVSGCTVSNNNCDINNIRSEGGGIYNYGPWLTITGSTVSSNSAYEGGGIWSDDPDNWGTDTLTNCTLVNNSGGLYGGGLFVTGSSGNRANPVTLTNCTLSLNSSAYLGGGIYVNPANGAMGVILNLTNTIVAGNTANTAGPDLWGSVTTADHSLVGDASGSSGLVNGVNGNIVGGKGNPVINADLGPLQNNGGPTETMALLAGSPAIGHADNSKAPTTDQRGVTRSDETGETTDIGAFEL
jgi:hypothetical protein